MRSQGHRKGSITHWGLLGEIGEGHPGVGWGELGRDSMERNARCGSKGGRHQITLPLCTYATILHVLHMYPKPKMQKKKKDLSDADLFKKSF